jgi:hypothetical protein
MSDDETPKEIWRSAILAAMDVAAQEIFGSHHKGGLPRFGAIDADLPELFKAIDAQFERVQSRI